MSGIATAVIGTSVVQGALQSRAADRAADAQVASSNEAIALQREQFEAIQELLAPYIEAGSGALGAQQDLLGLSGPEAQQAAIAQIQNSPQFSALVAQGEEGILQNAAATGGLRGGNTQGALAQFRPQVLNQLINQRFGQLGGLAQMGQNSAVGQGSFGQNMAGQVTNLIGQRGAAQAGEYLADAQAINTGIGGLTTALLGGF